MNIEFEWAAKDFTQGQLNAMVKKLIEAAGKDAPMKLLRDELEISVKKILGGLKLISDKITVGPLTKTFDSKEFFRNENKIVRLYIWDGFKDRVLAHAGKVSKQPATDLVSYDLVKPMHDSEIRDELPTNHLFAVDDLWMIAELIKNGKLLKNGCTNLFYVQVSALVLVVRVRWDGSGWNVSAWNLGGHGQWNDGSRVFSRNG
jgi:hypothetical protein